MSELENLVKVDIDSAGFKWIENLTFNIGNNTLNPNQKSKYFNSIIYLTCINLTKVYNKDPSNMSHFDITKHACSILKDIVLAYAEIALFKKDVTIDNDKREKLIKKINDLGFFNIFEGYIINLINNNNKPFILDSSIDHYSLGLDVEPVFINNLVEEFIPYTYNIENVEELKIGMSICGYSLMELVKKKPHSEIWKARNKSHIVALKLEPIGIPDKQLNTLKKGSDFTKIVNYIKENDPEFLNFLKIREYSYRLKYFNIEYYDPLKLKVKIMSWLEGPISNIVTEDKKSMLMSVANIIYELHKLRLVFGNICPNHIMILNSLNSKLEEKTITNYRLIDYKYINLYKGQNTNNTGHYRSLSLITGSKILTPYDDIESLLYVFNDTITGKVSYTDINDEINKKYQLDCYTSIVSDAIKDLRNLKQQDQYINGLIDPEDYPEYIKSIYEDNRININCISKIIMNIVNNYNEVADIDISLNKADYTLMKKIKTDLISHPYYNNIKANPNKINEISLQIMNYMLHGCEPDEKDRHFIYAYLN
jgi:REP element-mobilizing transposase RayT